MKPKTLFLTMAVSLLCSLIFVGAIVRAQDSTPTPPPPPPSPGGSMTITQTLRKNDLSLRDYVANVWDAHLHGHPPPSVFAD